MPPIAKEPLARALIGAALRQDAHQTADENEYISKQERKQLAGGIIGDSTDAVRASQPKGKWVHAQDVADHAMDRVRQVLGRVNQASGRGHALLSADEVRRATQLDPEVGALLKWARSTQRRQGEDRPLYTDMYNLPKSWQPAFSVSSGTVAVVDGVATLQGAVTDPSVKDLVDAAVQTLWESVLQHREWNGAVDLASNGTLRIGTYTDPETKITYQTADWIDIDDASQTLYFTRANSGTLELKILQFSN